MSDKSFKGKFGIIGPMLVVIGLVILALSLAGCSKDVSFASLEEAKNTARENSLFNAQRFRQENPQYQDWSVIPNGDSTQTASCPQGDGWATLKFLSPDKSQTVGVKCSTVSGATGCLLDREFKGKNFASQDGTCQSTANVPYPLPKIAK